MFPSLNFIDTELFRPFLTTLANIVKMQTIGVFFDMKKHASAMAETTGSWQPD